MSLAQQASVRFLDWNHFEITVFELHVAHRAVRAQRAQGFSIGANRQTARVTGAQHR